MDEVTIYPAPYRGPDEAEIEAARATLFREKRCLEDQNKRSALCCESCGTVSKVTNWTKISMWETSFGPYDRDMVHAFDMLKCPSCGGEHRLGWAIPELESLMQYMIQERRDD